jgi:SAM-dependent methyltransferase
MTHESGSITLSTEESISARSELFELLKSYPATEVEAERSLGLFLRASLMSRIFGIRELYEQIIDLPGIIVDVGTWRGQTAVVCENLRAIFEPLHFNRRIVAFDTFEGYQGFSERDNPTDTHGEGTYNVGLDYATYLEQLLVLHEKNNAMGHNNGKHTVISGDCRETIPQFFLDNSHEVVSLAFFDVNSYDPTEKAFESLFERLVPGGIISFWQLTRGERVQAEGNFYADRVLNRHKHSLHRSKFYPGLCYVKRKE